MQGDAFVCVGNTCRSVLAEFLARKFLPADFHFESAGIKAQEPKDAENVIFILHHGFGIDASAHQPRDVQTIDLTGLDTMIAIGDDVASVVKSLDCQTLHFAAWSIPAPWGGDLAEYETAAFVIRRKLRSIK